MNLHEKYNNDKSLYIIGFIYDDYFKDLENSVKYYNEYTGTVTVHLLNDNLERVHKIEYKEAYPYQISPLDLGYATNNSYLKLNVAFKYAWWQDTTIT